jgi:copper resistance protein B
MWLSLPRSCRDDWPMGNSAIARAFAALFASITLPAAAQASAPVSGEIELLELHLGEGGDHLVLESRLEIGGGADRFVLKLDGGSDTRPAFDDIELQAFYARALSDNVTVLIGGRQDLRAGSDLGYAALGVEVALTSWLEGEHFAYVSQHGDISGTGELTANWSLAKRLTLEPRLGFGWAGNDVPAEALGSGITDVEGSIRLRRALGEHADIYVGYVHERLAGKTRKIAIAAGDEPQVNRAVIGVGLRF